MKNLLENSVGMVGQLSSRNCHQNIHRIIFLLHVQGRYQHSNLAFYTFVLFFEECVVQWHETQKWKTFWKIQLPVGNQVRGVTTKTHTVPV